MRKDFSYRDDRNVPAWDEARALIVFDGECVLCSTLVHFVLRHDQDRRFSFTLAQSVLGQALYRHYELNPTDYETNLVIRTGRLYQKLDGFVKIMTSLGWPWRLFAALRVIPRPIGAWLYDRVAKNRYRIFGRYQTCMVPSAELRARIID